MEFFEFDEKIVGQSSITTFIRAIGCNIISFTRSGFPCGMFEPKPPANVRMQPTRTQTKMLF